MNHYSNFKTRKYTLVALRYQPPKNWDTTNTPFSFTFCGIKYFFNSWGINRQN